MIFKKKLRKFKPSKYSEIILKDCGKIILNDNEKLLFPINIKKIAITISQKKLGVLCNPFNK